MELFGLGAGLIFLLSLIPIALAIVALVDIAKKPLDPTMKIVWVLVILFFPLIGSIASLIVNRPPPTRRVTAGRMSKKRKPRCA